MFLLVLSLLSLRLGLLLFVNRSWFHKLQEVDTTHVRSQQLWYYDSFFGLVVFKYTADDSCACTHRGVQHVTEIYFVVHLLCLTETDQQSAGLVIRAIGTRTQLPERT